MSIQIAKFQKIHFKILYKFKVAFLLDFILFIPQLIKRILISDKEIKIYYPYYTSYTHPYIKERMYGKFAPAKWSTINKANLIHALQIPPKNAHNKYLIIEPNDQILTLSGYFGASTPKQCLEKIPEVKIFLSNELLKGIIIGNDGLYDQFRYYFGDHYLNKLIIFPMMRCMPKYSIEYFKEKIVQEKDKRCDFLFLASSYEIKAVKLVIDAWCMNPPINSTFYLVCNDIPKCILDSISNVKSIKIISQIPVKSYLKKKLFEICSVTIALTHIDGGGNAYEGIEYGHAIITNNFHRGKYLIGNDNGIIVDFKNKYYEPGKYGIFWNSFEEYLKIVKKDINDGFYEKAIEEISNSINLLNSNRELLNSMRIKSIEYSYKESIEESNKSLRKIYLDC